MNQSDTMTLMLLVAHFLALGVAIMVFGWMIFLQRRNRSMEINRFSKGKVHLPFVPDGATRPLTWLAVRSLEPQIVRSVLPDKRAFLVSPRVNGWVIVTGPGLPDPSENVDGCFRFLVFASRQLGHVQFFHMEKFSAVHAWARLDEGCVTRAYAWAGETIWNQGATTLAESDVGMKCSGYGEEVATGFLTAKENATANAEKIPVLAMRWSIDPEILHRMDDITGGSSRPY